jgi:hypothetical protein
LAATLSPAQPMALANNKLASESRMPTFLCPSDATHRLGLLDNRSDTAAADNKGTTSYKACCGANWAWAPFVNNVNARWSNDGNGLIRCDGFICSNSYGAAPSNMSEVNRNLLNMASITDGTSNTFAVGEAIPGWSMWSWWYCNNATVATAAIPLNYNRGIDKLPDYVAHWNRNYGFYSMHPSGAQFCYIDSSVRFIPDGVNLATYRALATTGSGEPTPSVQ